MQKSVRLAELFIKRMSNAKNVTSLYKDNHMSKKTATAVLFVMASSIAVAQTTYDSSTLVDTNNNSTSNSTVTSTNTTNSTSTNNSTSVVTSTSNNTNVSTNTNTNVNVNSGETTVNNNNVSTGTMTYNNNNVNSGTMTYNNNNTSAATNVNQNVNTGDMTNRNISVSDINQRVIQPPPTAVAPSMMSGGNSDLCTTGTSGSVQTQIFGVSTGGTIRDENCERLKLSKTLYDMGMKVAAVATMCQDRRVFDAMLAAGTPCPYEGKIGEAARQQWESNPEKMPQPIKEKSDDTYKKIGVGSLLGIAVYKLFGF